MRAKLIGVILSMASPAFAEEFRIDGLIVSDPIVRATSAMARTTAGYLSVANSGDTADTLIAVEADFPRVMMHDTVMDGDIAKMEHLMGVALAPGETVVFAPGEKHIMFMGLDGDPLEPGETVPAVLVFANAGRLEVTFTVEDRVPGEGHDSNSGH